MTDWLRHVPIAHRGLHDEGAGLIENSLSAFAAAVAGNYAIECDLRLSRDGEAVIFHDETLERLTTQSGAVESYRAKQLEQMSLRGSTDRIPSLSALLSLVGTRVPLLLELKRCEAPSGVLETRVTDLLADYTGPAAVQSFDPDILTWFRAHAPAIPRGLLARAEQDLLTPAIVAAQFIAYDVAALPAFGPAFARRIGLPVIAWTVRDEHTRSIAAQHADNIIFEGIRPKIPGGA
jgi:glycerophosphoryl diester phosphodiesterase